MILKKSQDIFEPLLTTYFDNILLLGGKEVEFTGASILLTPVKQNQYKPVKSDRELEKWAQSILIDGLGAKITINASWFGEHQLFYYADDSNALISSSFDTVVSFLRSRNISLELDEVAICESLVFEHPLRTRTFCRQIRKIMLGKKIEISLKPVSVRSTISYNLRFSDTDECPNENELIDRATEILSELITPKIRSMLEEQKVLLLLSGGVDSRLIGSLLKRSKIPFECITFGPWESADPYVAKKVAAELGVGIDHLLLEDADYKLYGDEVTKLSGGFSFHMHCHVYAVLKKNDIRSDFILHGNLAERSCASSKGLPVGDRSTKDKAMDNVLMHKSNVRRIWGLLNNTIKSEILNDLWETMDECASVNHPMHFYDYFSKVESNSALYSAIFNVVQPFGTPFSIYANHDYQDFFCFLPLKYREEKYLFKKACMKMFPQEFAIGTSEEIFAHQSLLCPLERSLSKALNIFSFGAFVFSGGRLWIPNPKNYERHRKVLFGVLKNDFRDAVEFAGKILDTDLSSFIKTSYANRTEIETQFRILSFLTIAKNFKFFEGSKTKRLEDE